MLLGGIDRGIVNRRAALRGAIRKRTRDGEPVTSPAIQQADDPIPDEGSLSAGDRHVRELVEAIIKAPASASEADRSKVFAEAVALCASTATSAPGVNCTEEMMEDYPLDDGLKGWQPEGLTWPDGSHCAACWMLKISNPREWCHPSFAYSQFGLPPEMDPELFQMLALLSPLDPDSATDPPFGEIFLRPTSTRLWLWRDVYLAMPLVGRQLTALDAEIYPENMRWLCAIVRHAPPCLSTLSVLFVPNVQRDNEPTNRGEFWSALADHLEARRGAEPMDACTVSGYVRGGDPVTEVTDKAVMERLGLLIPTFCKAFSPPFPPTSHV